jgi:hypothetical protein
MEYPVSSKFIIIYVVSIMSAENSLIKNHCYICKKTYEDLPAHFNRMHVGSQPRCPYHNRLSPFNADKFDAHLLTHGDDKVLEYVYNLNKTVEVFQIAQAEAAEKAAENAATVADAETAKAAARAAARAATESSKRAAAVAKAANRNESKNAAKSLLELTQTAWREYDAAHALVDLRTNHAAHALMALRRGNNNMNNSNSGGYRRSHKKTRRARKTRRTKKSRRH